MNNGSGGFLGFCVAVILILALGCAVATIGSIATATLNGVGRQIEAAQSEVIYAKAEATRAAIKSENRRREIDLQVKAASADSEARARATLWGALALAGAVALVGGAFGLTAWINKRATAIYPDARGQFPIIPKSGPGWTLFHDPNRALGPTTAIRTPTVLDALAGVAITTAKAIKGGSVPNLPTAEPSAVFPLPGSEPTMAQIATQEQVAQATIAQQSGRPKFILTTGSVSSAEREHDTHRAGGGGHGRMPTVTLVNNPKEIETFERKLLSGGDE